MLDFLFGKRESAIATPAAAAVVNKRLLPAFGSSAMTAPAFNMARSAATAPRAVTAAAPAEAERSYPFGKIEPYTTKYWIACGVGGVLSCGLTHTGITPLDLVKCNMQANPEQYKGIISGFGVLRASGQSIWLGWAPTLIGYSFQGVCKFGFYEFFKYFYGGNVSDEFKANYPAVLHAASSASAEFFADIALAPWEAVKVRVQTTPGFANGLMDGMPKIIAAEGINGLYKGLVPLWARQIPYTIMKFVAFERVVTSIYAAMPKNKEDYGKGVQLGVTLLSGYIAGVFCAVVSHPADTVVSQLNKRANATFGSVVSEMGFAGMWRGLVARVVMIGTLTGAQWLIYDSFKVFVGLPTTGGKK